MRYDWGFILLKIAGNDKIRYSLGFAANSKIRYSLGFVTNSKIRYSLGFVTNSKIRYSLGVYYIEIVKIRFDWCYGSLKSLKEDMVGNLTLLE